MLVISSPVLTDCLRLQGVCLPGVFNAADILDANSNVVIAAGAIMVSVGGEINAETMCADGPQCGDGTCREGWAYPVTLTASLSSFVDNNGDYTDIVGLIQNGMAVANSLALEHVTVVEIAPAGTCSPDANQITQSDCSGTWSAGPAGDIQLVFELALPAAGAGRRRAQDVAGDLASAVASEIGVDPAAVGVGTPVEVPVDCLGVVVRSQAIRRCL